MADKHDPQTSSRWRQACYEVIFKADTPAGKWFDIVLIVCITASVAVVMLDSVLSIRQRFGVALSVAEWAFTILFSIEYAFRLSCVRSPLTYGLSFFGVVDLLSILPTYLSVFVFGARYFAVVRVLRVLRVFRVLKLGHHTQEANLLVTALYASRRKIIVFLFAVLTIVVIIGSVIYVVEGPENGFTSIPRSVYWAIVTLTTVGYGDMAPRTAVGQTLAAFVMILGYSIIAVPTGIVTVEYSQTREAMRHRLRCGRCDAVGHDPDALYCNKCGARLATSTPEGDCRL